MSTHDALHSFDIHNDLLGRNSLDPDQQQHRITSHNNNLNNSNNNRKYTKRILLTGGAGFIGSVLVRKLVLNYPEYLIVVVDKLDYSSSLNNLRPFLLVSNNDEDDDQDTNSSQDTSSSTTTAATTPPEIPWTHSSDTLNPQDDTDNDPRKGNTRSNPLYPNFVFLEGDIIDVAFIESTMVEYRINTIYHLAAQTHVDKSFGQSIEFTQNNVLGTHVLLEAARKHFVPLSRKAVGKYEQNEQNQGQGRGGSDEVEEEKCAVENRFVFVSTDEVYGECRLGQPDCREDGLLAPSNPYSATKAAAECMVQAYYKSFKVPIIITRSNNVYGPFQYPEKIFPKFIMHLLYPNSLTSTSGSGPGSPKKNDNDISGGHCYIHGSGQHSRTYLYVADAANALDVILHRGLVGEVYNIGAGHELSNIELAQNLIHRLVEPLPAKSLHLKNGRETGRGGRGLNGYVREPEWSVIKRQEKACQHQGECQTCIDRIVFVEDRAFNDQRYAVDSTKLVGLGWSPSVDYEQGIVNTIEWFRNNGKWWWGDIHGALYPHSVKRSASEHDHAVNTRPSK
ncbi:hypothetical protein BGZ97_003658 [Linnemannia gamsii]|uniref:NAD-dependent epimerase/dehydratase domain-containing protein n=1 Tax=Linnemannia gamsii TaxID=64522 RepID=A0A9P6QSU1_9FUNG|nr:hypothetical protein BGZ97_003658 [Linnemannia gamsii]